MARTWHIASKPSQATSSTTRMALAVVGSGGRQRIRQRSESSGRQSATGLPGVRGQSRHILRQHSGRRNSVTRRVPAERFPPKAAFLRQEELPDGAALSLSAIRQVPVGDNPCYVIGGRRLDKDFIGTLELPAGMRAMLYPNLAKVFRRRLLICPSGGVQRTKNFLADRIHFRKFSNSGRRRLRILHWSDNAADDESVHAIPLNGQDNQLLGVLLVGNTRRPYVELRNRIRSAALLAGSVGIVLAILFSGWASSRVTRPVEQLAAAAQEVAAGNWNTRVPVQSSRRTRNLAESFNRMTESFSEQRERLVQVRACRSLAGTGAAAGA